MASSETNSTTDGKSTRPETEKSNNKGQEHHPVAPTSPTYPPYGVYHIDPAQLAANGYEVTDPVNFATYIYPISPQFSVQYYPDYSNGYQSYPGSPALHPQSPPMNPTTSPPFSPTFQYQNMAMSPPTHYIMPTQPFPPLHISSPVLSGTTSIPGSPPQHYLPGPYMIQADHRHKRHPKNHHHHHPQQQQQQLHQQPQEQELHDLEMNSYHSNNIYVRGLSSTTTDESFLELCQVYGSVTSSKAIIDQKTGECKGYGFALFETEQECEEAIEGLNKAGLQASYAKVGQESFSSRLRNLQDENSTNIYISNLPLDINEQALEELFQPYQTISNRILRDPQSGLSRGVGFARLTDREAATAVIEKFNGHSIEGCTAPLQVRFADSPAQKSLKSQTARKRVPRPVAAFAMRPMMPITPETMLGIAPAHAYYADHYVQPQFAAHILPKSVAHKSDQRQEDTLAENLEKKLNISDA